MTMNSSSAQSAQQRITDKKRAVVIAQENLSRAQRDASEQLVQAQRALSDLLGDLSSDEDGNDE